MVLFLPLDYFILDIDLKSENLRTITEKKKMNELKLERVGLKIDRRWLRKKIRKNWQKRIHFFRFQKWCILSPLLKEEKIGKFKAVEFLSHRPPL